MGIVPSRLTARTHICTASIHHFTASLGHKKLFIWKSNSRKSFVVLCFQKSCNLAAENYRSLHSVLCRELCGQSEVLSVSVDSSLVKSFTQGFHIQSCTSLPDLSFLSNVLLLSHKLYPNVTASFCQSSVFHANLYF